MNPTDPQPEKRPLMVTYQESINLGHVMTSVMNARGTGGISVRYEPTGLSIALRSARPGGVAGVPGVDLLPVKLTGRTSPNGSYTWAEQQWNKTSQIWENKPDGLTNASEGYSAARDIALRRTVPLNSVQFIAPDPFMVTSTDQPVYVFHPTQAWILMRITASSFSNGRGLYTASEVTLSEFTVTGVDGGLTLSSSLRNLAEVLNTEAISGTNAWYVGGVQANPAFSGAVYPSGFAPRPVGGGGTSNTHKRDQVVRVEESVGNPGTFIFSHPITHDGGCS